MNRNESSRLGEQQAEGNLGNERTRSSGKGRSGDRIRNRSGEGGMRERSGEAEDRASSEDSSSMSDMHDNNDARRGR